MMALPQNAPQSLTNLSDLVNEIWYHAGDQSVDVSTYTILIYFLKIKFHSNIFFI